VVPSIIRERIGGVAVGFVLGASSQSEDDACFSPHGVISSATLRSRLSTTRHFLSNQLFILVFFSHRSCVFAVLGVVGCLACPPVVGVGGMTAAAAQPLGIASLASGVAVDGAWSVVLRVRPPTATETLRDPRRRPFSRDPTPRPELHRRTAYGFATSASLEIRYATPTPLRLRCSARNAAQLRTAKNAVGFGFASRFSASLDSATPYATPDLLTLREPATLPGDS